MKRVLKYLHQIRYVYLIHSANHYHSAPISLSPQYLAISFLVLMWPSIYLILVVTTLIHCLPLLLLLLIWCISVKIPALLILDQKRPQKDPIQQVKMLTKLQKKETLTMRTINVLLCQDKFFYIRENIFLWTSKMGQDERYIYYN